ncbi:MAG: Mth938-like domain-containing protein [Micavibrio sp.]|nr:Mth938-like domain-containing protein [Micavibrio sp.]
MTDVTPLVTANAQVIQAYTNRGFRISGNEYLGAVLVVQDKVVPLDVASVTQLTAANFDALDGTGTTYLIIGAGKSAMLDVAIMQKLKAKGIVAEIMEIGAACRTYNVLRTEGRMMAAALIPAGVPAD